MEKNKKERNVNDRLITRIEKRKENAKVEEFSDAINNLETYNGLDQFFEKKDGEKDTDR
ncbi:hypothetical protein [Bacillus sp. EB01]|uniref:hypothetical protein n=1 Tax=Bacillus sp. EB01 TaxID=1347086 RepID=UPI000B12DCD1|nr:hypothetical protein [Bacillus sp. EB01]